MNECITISQFHKLRFCLQIAHIHELKIQETNWRVNLEKNCKER